MSVSIIIPVHNSEEYLEECVNSVLPGMNEDDEIILVENGSSDSSWDMCRDYSSRHPNVKAVSLDASGISTVLRALMRMIRMSMTCVRSLPDHRIWLWAFIWR